MRPIRRPLGLLIALLPLLTLAIIFTPAAAAPAAHNYVVGDGVHPSSCNTTSLAAPMNIYADLSITFNCGGPATIAITQSGGLNVVFGQSVTINGGDDITLTGNNTYRLFYVQANSALTLTHIVLTHGFDITGGAILEDDAASLTLDHVTANRNQSLDVGGAILNFGGALKVTNSLFENNSGSSGGAIQSRGSLTVSNTSFRNNVGFGTGGALYVIDSASINGGQMISNSAAYQGGALDVNPGAVVTVDRVTFDHNYTLTNTASLLYNGGAIHNAGLLTLTHSSLTHNTSVHGGAIFNDGSQLYLSNATLLSNTAVANGGALANLGGGYAQLDNTAALQNYAGGLGGGLYTDSGLLLFQTQSSLIANTAQAGGGLYVKAGGSTTLLDGFVEGNTATNANGGGLYLELGSGNGIGNVFFQGNHAAGTGGAIDNLSNGFILNDSTLIGNSAGVQGGGLYNHGSNVSLEHDILRGNSAGTWGGGLDNQGWIKLIDETTIQGNTAIAAGGLYNEAGGVIDVVASTISGNSASAQSGGALNALNAALTLENSTLSGNSAGTTSGGLRAEGPITLSEVTLSNNSSPSGGALYIEPSVSVVLTDTLLAYSAGGNCVGSLARAVSSTSSDNTCALTNFVGSHNHDGLDPLLTALGNYGGPTLVHMLKHNSPVLDSVFGNGPFSVDQRGQPRPGLTSWDPGAVERQTTDSDLAPWLFLPLLRR